MYDQDGWYFLVLTICLIAISSDFLDILLPKPELSGDDFIVGLQSPERWLLLCLGGGSFLAVFTLSDVLFRIKEGFDLPLPFTRDRAVAGTELPLWWTLFPFGALPLKGEQDCLLGLATGPGSTDDDREVGAPGLPREAERGLSGNDVLKFGGVSALNPGISNDFHGLDFTVGELPRVGTEVLDITGTFLTTGNE